MTAPEKVEPANAPSAVAEHAYGRGGCSMSSLNVDAIRASVAASIRTVIVDAQLASGDAKSFPSKVEIEGRKLVVTWGRFPNLSDAETAEYVAGALSFGSGVHRFPLGGGVRFGRTGAAT